MAEKEQVVQALRATLISVKGAITIKQCNRDYRELQGEWIPYKKLGYPSLEKLFLDVPGFKVTQNNGDWFVDAMPSQETQHLASMIARQKTSKKAPIKLNQTNRFPKNQGSWRKPASGYQTNYYNQYSKQYYRPKGVESYTNNNNYKNNKSTYKTNETKHNNTANSKQPARTILEVTGKPAAKNNSNSSQAREVNTHSTESRHSIRPSNESEVKPTVKVSASQRLSNLRDRLNRVDLIPLQLPAANNERLEKPEETFPPVETYQLELPPDSTSSVLKLEWTCKRLGLPEPVYNVQDLRPKGGPVSYDCTVKVGASYSVSSYPDSSPSADLAKEVAAVKLLTAIESANAPGLPTSSNSKAMLGLSELVSEHEAGLWANTVPHLYRKKYQENLPSNWQELMENCPRIKKERVVNGLLVLLSNKEEYPYIEANLIEETIDSELPPLQFPDDDFWNVFVTVANSTLEIWLRIIGPEYSDAFEELLADMAKYYEHSGTLVDKSMIIKNAWYAVNLEDGGWQRAKILEVEDGCATVFLGDHGDDDVVQLHNIKILEPQFRKLPTQAILCRLEGAEELAASTVGADLVRQRLPGGVLVAAPGPRDDPHDPAISLVLYDTSTPRDLNLNKEIVHDFCIAGAFALTQKPCEVEVGCVTEEGRVWVSRAGGAATVRCALALLTSGPYRRPLPSAPDAPPPSPGTLYIVRTLAGDWVRCTIISGLDGEGTVRTQLIDSGLILRAPLSSLVPLQTFSPALNAYPPQAMQVRLGQAERAAGSMVARLRELLLNRRVLCRALPASPHSPSTPVTPHVELFVRSGPQNILASVNNSILIEYDLQNGKTKEDSDKTSGDAPGADPVEALHRKKERLFRSTAGEERHTPLPPPPLPAPGRCFDVHVAMAANPWNFVVQPISTRHTLLTMMASLQTECAKFTELDAPTNPASGELYTMLYEKDATWYRVMVAGTVSTEMVSVYFCDFGDLALVGANVLRPVPAGAPLARTLPPQAIKARLYDVCPLHQDWTVEDCIRFQELCVEQQFVGICKEVGKDPLNPQEPLLTLDLIDTSTDEDVYVNRQLVVEGRARLASATPTATPTPTATSTPTATPTPVAT